LVHPKIVFLFVFTLQTYLCYDSNVFCNMIREDLTHIHQDLFGALTLQFTSLQISKCSMVQNRLYIALLLENIGYELWDELYISYLWDAKRAMFLWISGVDSLDISGVSLPFREKKSGGFQIIIITNIFTIDGFSKNALSSNRSLFQDELN